MKWKSFLKTVLVLLLAVVCCVVSALEEGSDEAELDLVEEQSNAEVEAVSINCGSLSGGILDGCKFLANQTLPFGGTLVLSGTTPSVTSTLLTGQAEISGGWWPSVNFTFRVTASTGSPKTSMVFTRVTTGNPNINLAALARSVSNNVGFNLDSVAMTAIDAVLSPISLNPKEFAVTLFPHGARFTCGVSIAGMDFDLTLVAYQQSSTSTAVAATVAFPMAAIQQKLQDALGPVYDAVALFTVSDLSVAAANADLSSLPSVLLPSGRSAFINGFELKMGFYFSKTATNDFQKWLGNLIGESVFTFFLRYQSAQSKWSGTLALPDIPLSSSVTMTQTQLSVTASPGSGVAFSLQVGFNFSVGGQPLIILGGVSFTPGTAMSVTLRLQMVGTVNNVFGVPRLALSNLYAEFSVMFEPPFFKGYRVGGTITWGAGQPTDPVDAVSGTFGVGIDLVEPKKNFFFIEISGFTIGQVVYYLLGLSKYNAVPGILKVTGIENAKYSYSLVAQTFNGYPIPQGYFISGVVNLFGWKIAGTFQASSSSVMIDLVFGPVSLWDNRIRLLRSADDSTQGPRFYMKMDGSSLGEAWIEGYLATPIFEFYLKMVMGDNSMTFNTTANIYDFASCSIMLTTTYDSPTSWDSAFSVNLNVANISSLILDDIRAARELINNRLNDAKSDVQDAQAYLRDEAASVCNGGSACSFNCTINLLEEETESDIDRSQFGATTEAFEAEETAKLQAMVDIIQDLRRQYGDVDLEPYLEQQYLQLLETDEASFLEVDQSAYEALTMSRAGWIKKIWKKFKKGVVNPLRRVAVRTWNQVADGLRRLASSLARWGCNLGQDACGAGCLAARSTVRAAANSLNVASGTLEAVKSITSTALGIIDDIISGFQLSVTFASTLSTSGFTFTFNFSYRLSSNYGTTNFSLQIDIRWFKVVDLVRIIVQRIRDTVMAQAPMAF
eukprot:TRINITY_DN2344_c0_g1_i2.p1 TRINITY_DN2344_c0_g1~~TRINITY_DN2344_c0_g1_i2.p1  ORF type:complete len:952 (-),score=301.89 TRINITY_DN2344_c0_g1_i2:75-2930(-)